MDMTDLKIRRMTIEDYDSLTDLWRSAGLEYRSEGRDSLSHIAQELEQSTSIFLVAELDGRIVGSLLCTHDGRKGWMNHLAVSPEYRRRGIGTALVQEGQKRLEVLGIEVVAALIWDWNQTSVAFFENIGYEFDPAVRYYSIRRSPES